MDIKSYYGKKIDKLDYVGLRKEDRVNPPVTIKKIYIIGICGTAMGSIAGLLKQAGYEVSGWDSGVYPPMSTMLEDLGIEIQTEVSEDSLADSDIIVVGNAVGPTHEVVSLARTFRKPLVSLSEVLDLCIFKGRKRLVIAGTHGKTTTTGIVAAIFKEAKMNPGYLIGGVMQGKSTGFDIGGGDYFIIEGDEYDTAYFDKRPKFLTYGASGAMVTAIELDHMDIYSDLKDYEKAFSFFAEGLPEGGSLFIADEEAVKRIMKKTKANVFIYGFEDWCDVYIKNVSQEGLIQKGVLVYKGKELGEIETSMSGKHNLMNIVGAAGLAYSYGISFEDIKSALKNFKGMKRRQEVIADGYATLIDDFAHHPTAVSETIAGIKKLYEGRRLVAIFEPRSNTSRRKEFEKPYVDALSSADLVFIKQPKSRHNDDSENYIDVDKMAEDLKDSTNFSCASDSPDDIKKIALENLNEGDVVLMMSNGSFDGLRESLVKEISSR